MKYDLTCIIPLYGDNCEDTSLRMVSSLAIQKTKYKVRYLFFSDETVSDKTLEQINFLLGGRNLDFHIIRQCDTSSGYKRNLGIQLCLDYSEFIWFIDQDDYLIKQNTFDDIINGFRKYPQINLARVKFLVPDDIGEENRKSICETLTMPFQWVIRTECLRDLRFKTNIEYASDISITIALLVKEGYVKVQEDLKLQLIKFIPRFEIALYYYNYLNDHSYMRKHFEMEKEDKDKEVIIAKTLLAELKENEKE